SCASPNLPRRTHDDRFPSAGAMISRLVLRIHTDRGDISFMDVSKYQRARALYAAMLAALLFSAALQAQEFPAKPLRLIVPYSVGSPPDIVGRIAASHMQATLGQPVVVDNRPGAGGTVGLAELGRPP